jgi:hypothetical protein
MSESREKLPSLESLPAKWQAEYRRVLPLAIERYAGQWSGVEECEYQIHLFVVNCWRAEQKAQRQVQEQGTLFG